jgi:glutaredoxin-like protein NrdH
MDKLGISYEAIDVTANQDAFDMLVEKGFKAMPVVNAGDEWWSGFNPEKINGLVL